MSNDSFNTNQPLISIIIPCYNVATNMIDKCIDSILKQEYFNFEVIIIDDGSKENISDYLDSIAHIDNRIRVFHQNNKGVSAARNNGINRASGDYITFVDADDFVVPYFLSECVKVIIDENADMVIGGLKPSADDNPNIIRNNIDNYTVLSGENIVKFRPFLMGKLYRFNGGAIGRGPVSRLIRKSIVEQIGFNERITIGEDGIWNIQVLDNCHKICIVEQTWYIYYANQDSATKRYNPGIISECEKYFSMLAAMIDLNNNDEYVAYVDRILELLKIFVYRRYLGTNLIKRKEKRKQIKYLYNNSPWNIIKEKKYLKHVGSKNKFKAYLYKYRLLFLFWGIRLRITGKM